jgi:hypothetical protein
LLLLNVSVEELDCIVVMKKRMAKYVQK